MKQVKPRRPQNISYLPIEITGLEKVQLNISYSAGIHPDCFLPMPAISTLLAGPHCFLGLFYSFSKSCRVNRNSFIAKIALQVVHIFLTYSFVIYITQYLTSFIGCLTNRVDVIFLLCLIKISFYCIYLKKLRIVMPYYKSIREQIKIKSQQEISEAVSQLRVLLRRQKTLKSVRWSPQWFFMKLTMTEIHFPSLSLTAIHYEFNY